MKKIEKQYLDVLENHGWAVSSYTGCFIDRLMFNS